MTDDIRNPADTSRRNHRSIDWYEPRVQQGWTVQTGVPCPENITSDKVYGHDIWDAQNQIVIPVDPYVAYYYDDPNDPLPDTEPPEVSAQVTGDQNGDGKYISEVQVVILASDVSGVDIVEYKIGDAGDWTEYANPLVFDTEGEYVVYFRATDNAGNTSAVDSVNFEVVAEDTTPPNVTAMVEGDQNQDGAYIGQATVTITAVDQ